MAVTKHILVVEDDALMRELVSHLLASAGYAVTGAGSGQEALACLEKETFDLVTTDNGMPGMSGVEMALAIKARRPALPIVMLSGNPPQNPMPCLELVLHKPGGILSLMESVRGILEGKPRREPALAVAA